MSEGGSEIDEVRDLEQRTLGLLLAINAVMFVVEAIAGWRGESTGLMGDSLDMLADASVYAIALFVVGRSVGRQRMDPEGGRHHAAAAHRIASGRAAVVCQRFDQCRVRLLHVRSGWNTA